MAGSLRVRHHQPEICQLRQRTGPDRAHLVGDRFEQDRRADRQLQQIRRDAGQRPQDLSRSGQHLHARTVQRGGIRRQRSEHARPRQLVLHEGPGPLPGSLHAQPHAERPVRRGDLLCPRVGSQRSAGPDLLLSYGLLQ